MGTVTIVADVVEALVDLWTADTAVAAVDGLKVFDGPPATDRARPIEVWVGATGLEQADDAATFTRRPVVFGGGASGAGREQIIDVPCAVWVIGGQAGPAGARARRRQASDVLDLLAAALAAGQGDLGLGPVLCGGADIATGSLREIQSPDGAAAHLTFTVRVTARV